MQHDILDKLYRVLAAPIVGEPHVLYVMAEIRKVLEHIGKPGDQADLSFFCDWALHIRIDRATPAGVILRRLDQAVEQHLNSPEFVHCISEIISLGQLRKELRRFAVEWNLPRANFDDFARGLEFSKFYTRIISEVPLVSTRDPLDYVEEFLIGREGVERVDEVGAPEDSLCWRIPLKGDRDVYGAFLFY